ncbi:hypothetical protein [Nocardia sp. NPDC005366]|uniref:hypothetical protein n=1 Tax=Nocardia sp. NPDC005366 TaxID=3156878 RepID=UPI0033AC0642
MDIDITCPTCGRLDWVQSVPALCTDGTAVSFGSGSYSGFGMSGGGLVPVFGTMTVDRTHTTTLAQSFAREPAWKPTRRLTRWGCLLLIPAFFMALILTLGVIYTEEPGAAQVQTAVGSVFLVGFTAAPGLLCLAVVWARRRHNNRVLRGRPAAHGLWRAGFYCHRCGWAFWPYSPVAGIPVRQSLAPQQFRWYVWQVGRYFGP